ncbi:MAG TPA: methyltransferase domain-containing protein [Steroidobacteraceae bacterium]|nr:methyltransferase domain-containing protein [Steroidobacteraceae bacterium]
MTRTRTLRGAATALACLAAFAATATEPPVTDAETLATLDKVLAGDHRSDENCARDKYRHPKETLQFFGFRQDMAVMEVSPGGGGWYTEVLAPTLREKGTYIAAGWDPNATSEYAKKNSKKYADKLASRPELYDRAKVTALQAPNALKPVPDGSVDMVLTFRNIHGWMGDDAADAMFKAMYAALKPGGILGVAEHRAKADKPQDPKAESGYVREDYAIAMIEKAGFKLIGKSDVNANPKDTADHPKGVWTLPPTLQGGDVDRDKYLAIGESDRFTLRFRKPE